MGFSHAEYSGSEHYVPYKAALIFALTRWVLSWTLKFLKDTGLFSFSFSSPSSSSPDPQSETVLGPSSSSSSSTLQLQGKVNSNPWIIRDNLNLTTFGDIEEKLPGNRDTMTCAVCLNRLRKRDQVRKLANCCHVFHRLCLDKWLDHDIHMTCPLCRAPLLAMRMTIPSPNSSSFPRHYHEQPSWAVERLLYLFGDDLLR